MEDIKRGFNPTDMSSGDWQNTPILIYGLDGEMCKRSMGDSGTIYEHSNDFLTCRLLSKDAVLHAGRISGEVYLSIYVTYGIMFRIYDRYVPLHELYHVQRSLCGKMITVRPWLCRSTTPVSNGC